METFFIPKVSVLIFYEVLINYLKTTHKKRNVFKLKRFQQLGNFSCFLISDTS
ncbi:MAG: hypothetical protein K0Q95_1990 [Bacteroidota bacterium]|jgi:hypothetical protein|nr:hypothetical protein [Bacteroidota bacterium]